MTLAGYRRTGIRKRSNLRLVKKASKHLIPTLPTLTIEQLRRAGQEKVQERMTR